ncbi:phycobilisome rod-core linker polypeptide [Synechococcus sp. M16CYN]|uniref:phycobilisome rod-core linker polypeptide n=1 Tax=Synechococcus sp. M16CYN TaxID=3103139 RepID=UPI00324DBD9B
MVVIKPIRDFTSLSRVSYTFNNVAKPKQKTAINRYREEERLGKPVLTKGLAAKTVYQYKENLCNTTGIGIGQRIHSECPFTVDADEFASTGNDALKAAITAAYKQIFGNLGLTENQCCIELESRLRHGSISIRDFVAGLAKSDFYKQNYFFQVSPIRGIELSYKHLLGRPPINQTEVSAAITLIAEQGFDNFIEKITHSEEYLEIFGTNTVPYLRAWTSAAGTYCSTFTNLGRVTPGNAASDTTIESRSQLLMEFSNARRLSTAEGGYEVLAFSYSRAMNDPTSGAFARIFSPKTTKFLT